MRITISPLSGDTPSVFFLFHTFLQLCLTCFQVCNVLQKRPSHNEKPHIRMHLILCSPDPFLHFHYCARPGSSGKALAVRDYVPCTWQTCIGLTMHASSCVTGYHLCGQFISSLGLQPSGDMNGHQVISCNTGRSRV